MALLLLTFIASIMSQCKGIPTATCDFNSILEIPDHCGFTKIEIFSSGLEINWIDEIMRGAIGLVSDSLPVGGTILNNAMSVISDQIYFEDDDFNFQTRVNEEFQELSRCIPDSIQQNYIDTQINAVVSSGVFVDLKDCSEIRSWGEIEDCLDDTWREFKDFITSNFGSRRTITESNHTDYARKLPLYDVLRNGFGFFATSYLEEVYNQIMTTNNPEVRIEECGEFYTYFGYFKNHLDIFRNWINEAFTELSNYYEPTTNFRFEPNCIGVSHNWIDDVHQFTLTPGVYPQPLRYDWNQFLTTFDGNLHTEFSVNYGIISSNTVHCDAYRVSCSINYPEEPDYDFSDRRRLVDYDFSTPDIRQCCAGIQQKQNANSERLYRQYEEWKQNFTKSYIDILDRYEELFASYPSINDERDPNNVACDWTMSPTRRLTIAPTPAPTLKANCQRCYSNSECASGDCSYPYGAPVQIYICNPC